EETKDQGRTFEPPEVVRDKGGTKGIGPGPKKQKTVKDKQAVSATESAPRPNIVLIVSDDQGVGDYGFMGHPQVRTPNRDRLASQSLLFSRGCSVSSLCCPSLASILSGMYPHQSKITCNDPPKPPGKTPAELVKDAGYQRLRRQMIDHITHVPTLPR